VEERGRLSSYVDRFEKERIPEVQDAAAELDDSARRKTAEYVRQLRRAAADLKSKEFESSLNQDGLMDRYRIGAIEQEIASALSSPK
jgi:hypothetical protein